MDFLCEGFCVAAVKVKNDLERNKAIARSVPEKCPVFFGLNGIRKMAEIHRCQAEQGRMFSPQTGCGIFGSAISASLGGIFSLFFPVVPNVIRSGLTTIYKACSCSQHTKSGAESTGRLISREVCTMPFGIQLYIYTSSSARSRRAVGAAIRMHVSN